MDQTRRCGDCGVTVDRAEWMEGRCPDCFGRALRNTRHIRHDVAGAAPDVRRMSVATLARINAADVLQQSGHGGVRALANRFEAGIVADTSRFDSALTRIALQYNAVDWGANGGDYAAEVSYRSPEENAETTRRMAEAMAALEDRMLASSRAALQLLPQPARKPEPLPPGRRAISLKGVPA